MVDELNDLVASLTENQTLVRVATCSLSQFVLDYKNNTQRIINSIKVAKQAGCTYRVGPELEITGYSCEDHFYEMDTLEMSWLYLGKILKLMSSDNDLKDILCDIGTLVIHKGVRYNCRIFCLNGKILLIRPKMYLADDGNYREHRWFTGWQKHSISLIEDCLLPVNIQKITKQTHAKFGVAMLECIDGTTIASEICEELFTPESPNIMLGLDGCDIISNGSGSHFQLGKRERRHQLIGEATKKNGGVYLYSNLVGCDGSRLVFDGNSMVYMNGKLVVCGEHLTWHNTEVVVATVDLNDVRGYRAAIVSSNDQSVHRDVIVPRIKISDCFENTSVTKDEAYDNCSKFKLTLRTNSKITNNHEVLASLITDVEFESLWRLNQLDSKSSKNKYEIYSDAAVVPANSEDPIQDGANNFKSDKKQLPMELGDEIGLYTSRWIWDYTIRCGAGGYLLPLSGGVDSTSTAMVIYYMCDIIVTTMKKANPTKNDERLKGLFIQLLENGPLNNNFNWKAELKDGTTIETLTTRQLMYLFLHTVNMPTKNNSAGTAEAASNLASILGSYHLMAPIQKGFEGFVPDYQEEEKQVLESVTSSGTGDVIAGGAGDGVAGDGVDAETDHDSYDGEKGLTEFESFAREYVIEINKLDDNDAINARIATMATTHGLNAKSETPTDDYSDNLVKISAIVDKNKKQLAVIKGLSGHILINNITNKIKETIDANGKSITELKLKNQELLIKQVSENNTKNTDIVIGYYNYKKPDENKYKLIVKGEPIQPPNEEDELNFTWENNSNFLITPTYKPIGDWKEHLAIQNVQARLRMLTAYYLSQTLPLYRWDKRNNQRQYEASVPEYYDTVRTSRPNQTTYLLVLGSSNSDEALRGFFTKYDAASADVNPIGSLSKTHLREFLRWCGRKWTPFTETINGILDTVASPELTPEGETIQDDEEDIGMTYEQLYELGKLRKEEMCGPLSMFRRYAEMKIGKPIVFVDNGKKNDIQSATYTQIAKIVCMFFHQYNMNRNKMTIVPASVHGTGYSPDDNRHDLRPVFYPAFRGSETERILLALAQEYEKNKSAPAAPEEEEAINAASTPTLEGLAAQGGSYPKYTRRYKEVSNKHTRSRK